MKSLVLLMSVIRLVLADMTNNNFSSSTPTMLSSAPSPLYSTPTMLSSTPSPLYSQDAMPSSGGQRRLPVISSTTVSAFGRTWFVRDSGGERVPPGPCIFTTRSDRVWVDDRGIHLTVAPNDCECTGWASTEVWDTAVFGYGTYVFQITGQFVDIDPQVTFGLFVWDDDAPETGSCSSEGACYFREIDFEVSRWGVLSEPQLQFVRQPALVEGNRKRVSISSATRIGGLWGSLGGGDCCSFTTEDGGFNNANIESLTLVMQWYSGPPRPLLRFFAFDGQYSLNTMNQAGPHLLSSWEYPYPNRIPDVGDARVHFNLWQANWGGVPGFGRIAHVLIAGVEHSSAWIDLPALGIPLEGQYRRSSSLGRHGVFDNSTTRYRDSSHHDQEKGKEDLQSLESRKEKYKKNEHEL